MVANCNGGLSIATPSGSTVEKAVSFRHFSTFASKSLSMSKAFLIASVMAVGATAAAVTSYVSPAAPSELDVPPIEVNAAPDAVMAKLERMTAQQYFTQITGKPQDIPTNLQFKTERVGNLHVKYTARIGGELVGEIDAFVSELSFGHSSIDVQAHLTDSKFSRHQALHPYDIKVMESVADLAVTDYVSSVIKAERMASEKELGKEIERRIAFSDEQGRNFGKRVEEAFEASYARDLYYGPNHRDSRYREYNFEGSSRYGEPMMRPGATMPVRIVRGHPYDAAEEAAEAADAAAGAAQAAGDAARDAAAAW
jgi:hypothetical protein